MKRELNCTDFMISRAATPLPGELRAGYPVITIIGPRQSGKTTWARAAFPDKPHVSLETPVGREFAATDPRNLLPRCSGGATILGACRTYGTSAANRPQRSSLHRLFDP
ncbi:MAG TPA: hypothetical protein PLB25_12055 [Rhodoferax sp.]|nr:hypothetical protein [Rhodoferax sp.]